MVKALYYTVLPSTFYLAFARVHDVVQESDVLVAAGLGV